MKKLSTLMLVPSIILFSALGNADSSNQDSDKKELQSKESRFSYFLAHRDVENFISEGLTIDLEAFAIGANAAKEGVDSIVSQEEAVELGEYFAAQIAERKNKEVEQNKSQSENFLAENATKDGVVTLASGLQYKVLELGDGDTPTASSTVQVHYEGRLISGEVFDSSIARGVPAEFPLSGVISGWTEGLQLMPEGSKFEFYIPSELAYGSQGTRSIGPNETLIFVVELLQANVSEG